MADGHTTHTHAHTGMDDIVRCRRTVVRTSDSHASQRGVEAAAARTSFAQVGMGLGERTSTDGIQRDETGAHACATQQLTTRCTRIGQTVRLFTAQHNRAVSGNETLRRATTAEWASGVVNGVP